MVDDSEERMTRATRRRLTVETAPLRTIIDSPSPLPVHPSAPIPVQGVPLGAHVRVPLGETGVDVFPVILGGAAFGTFVDAETSHDILDAYWERGGNAVHTCDDAAGGRSEHIIGEWLRTRGVRDQTVLAVRVGAHPDHAGLGAVSLVRAVEASLTRLCTDRIDVLYLNAAAGVPGMENTLATAEWLVESGKVRSVGAYAFTAEQLVEARILSSAGYPRLTVLDVPYSVQRRAEFTGDLRLVATAQGMAVTPSQELPPDPTERRRVQQVRALRAFGLSTISHRRATRVLRTLQTLGRDLGVPAAAVGIAWLMAQRVVAAPIVNPVTTARAAEFVQGVGVKLNRVQLAEIGRTLA